MSANTAVAIHIMMELKLNINNIVNGTTCSKAGDCPLQG